MVSVSIHSVILENTDSWFVVPEEGSCVEDIWDAFPRLHTRTQHSRITVPLEWPPALSWTSGKLGSYCVGCVAVLGKGRWVLQKTKLSN